MASPQCENGFLRLANELVDAFAKTRLAGQEYQVVWAVIRKTYGFGKKSDKISYGQLSAMTGLDRRRVFKIVKDLSKKKVLTITNNGDRRPVTICINKNYDQWATITKNGAITNNDDRTITNNDDKSVTNNGDYKIYKERNIPSDFFNLSKRYLEYQQKQHGNLVKITESKINGGADAIDKLVRIDGFDLEQEIRPVLSWAAKDSFWSTNVLSLAGLRKKQNNGESKFQNIYASYKRKNKNAIKQTGPVY